MSFWGKGHGKNKDKGGGRRGDSFRGGGGSNSAPRRCEESWQPRERRDYVPRHAGGDANEFLAQQLTEYRDGQLEYKAREEEHTRELEEEAKALSFARRSLRHIGNYMGSAPVAS